MPSLRKLSLLPANLLPKVGKDLTVFATSITSGSDFLSEVNMDYSSALDLSLSDNGGLSDSSSSSPRARKRERLDHLSQEEKLMRRKIKNRVAAQSARDRKKAKMTELEEQVMQLEKQKKYLILQNSELRNKTSKLEEENAELRLRLKLDPLESLQHEVKEMKDVKENTASQAIESQVKMEVDGSFEYAERTGSGPSYSFDDAIRLLASNSETDAFLDILQQCSDDLLQYDVNNTQSDCREEEKDCELSNKKMVGPTSKGMESIKELILFDHIYHKQDNTYPAQPQISSAEVIEVETSELNSDDFILPHDVIVQAQPVTTNMQNIPVIHIEEDDSSTLINSNSMPIHILPCSTYEISLSEDKSIPSPSSDAGYDSSFSALSPCSDAYTTNNDSLNEDEPWDDSFTELFPSLV